MTKEHINTFLVIAERARQAGLIQFEEMPAVLQAIASAKEVQKQPEQAQQKDNEQDIQNKAGGRQTKD
jgi:hypothetical protein